MTTLRHAFIMGAIAAAPAVMGQTTDDETFAHENDSTDINQLNEVVVKAARVIHRADRDIYSPNEQVVKLSTTGMDLLNKLQIPTLNVNTALDKITVAGEDVQIRINGREATIKQLKAINPTYVKRIEFHDNPGLRYGSAVAVVDVITTNPEVGGSFMDELTAWCPTKFYVNELNLTLNHGKSQFEISVLGRLQSDLSIYRQYDETFTYPDGSQLHRVESPLPGQYNQTALWPTVSYSYINPDKTTLWLGAGADTQFKDITEINGQMTLSDGSPDLLTKDIQDANMTEPWISAYLEQKFKNKQTLAVNLYAQLYSGRSSHEYTETYLDGVVRNDVSTDIKEFNQIYKIDANYIKEWSASSLTLGMSYSASRNRSKYLSLDGAIYHQKQDKAYAYAEYTQRINKLTATVGAGINYHNIRAIESNSESSSWFFRPRLSLTYRLSDLHRFNATIQSWSTSPTLEQSNEAPQQTDGFQWQIGNADLHSYNTYDFSTSYTLSQKIISAKFRAAYRTSPDIIAETYYWDNDRLIKTFSNDCDYKAWSLMLAPQIQVIPNWLTLSGSITYQRAYSKGTDFSHIHGTLSYDVSAMLTHWNGYLMFKYFNPGKQLSGQTLTEDEVFSFFTVGYNYRDFNFSVGYAIPFGHYRQGSYQLNKYNTNNYILRSKCIERQLLFKVSYAINWGHQRQGVNKLLDASTSVQSTNAATR